MDPNDPVPPPRVPAEGARRAGVLWEQRASPGAEPAQPGLTTRRWFMLRVLLYENTGSVTACSFTSRERDL